LNQYALAHGGISSLGRIAESRSIFIINPILPVTLDADPALKVRLGLGNGSDADVSIGIDPLDPPFACFTDPGAPFKDGGVNRMLLRMLSRLPSLSFRTGVLALRIDMLPSIEPASPISADSRTLVSLLLLSIGGGILSLKNDLAFLSSLDLDPG
jgi:hypothetical protein